MTITGYATSTSVIPGGTIQFCLSSDVSATVSFTVERLPLDSGGPASDPQSVTVNTLSPPAAKAWEGFGWPTALNVSIPATWPSGVYQLLDQNRNPAASFIVLSSAPGTVSRVISHVPFLTFAAYNSAGGKSLYGYNSGGEAARASRVSLDRPFLADDGTPAPLPGEWNVLLEWLNSQAITVDYCSSGDLHAKATLLTSYDCLLLAGHDEYWTRSMRDNVQRFVANGGNVISLSGNTCYRAVRLENANRLVVFFKYAAEDPATNDDQVTVAWADPPLNEPPNTLFGVGWTCGSYGASGPGGRYAVTFPSHWVFENLTVNAGSTFCNISYETDAADFVVEPEGYPRVTGADDTPLAFTILATADLRQYTQQSKPGFGTMGLYSRNGTVFNASVANEWLWQLDTDPIVSQVTKNVLARLGRRVPWDWELIGRLPAPTAAPLGRALAATGGKLYLATSLNELVRRYPVGADVAWKQIGTANNVVAMTASNDLLYCVTDDNQLWSRPAVEDSSLLWTSIGNGPASGTRALAAAGGMLYIVDGTTGALWRVPASSRVGTAAWAPLSWFTPDGTVNAMTAYQDILIASTTDNRLLRSASDWIDESTSWVQFWHCDYSVGLGVVEWMLFVVTSHNLIWRLDLSSVRSARTGPRGAVDGPNAVY
jgi:hypothetical protein